MNSPNELGRYEQLKKQVQTVHLQQITAPTPHVQHTMAPTSPSSHKEKFLQYINPAIHKINI